MDEQWGYVGAKSRQRWLFYAYDRLRKTVVAHVFGERTMATLGRLMSLLSPFDVVIWMTDGWPLYESRLKGKLHVISKRYTQRIERHNHKCVEAGCKTKRPPVRKPLLPCTKVLHHQRWIYSMLDSINHRNLSRSRDAAVRISAVSSSFASPIALRTSLATIA
ncbi:IS1 transposase family protein [Shigella dysenteriae 1617]|nr:IS1 transposase family protein [Shigella dysenteriae 1617]SPZ81010.1 IS1 ORF2 [Shigella dysenteriae]